MNEEKAYKLLALQENLSNNEAKQLIDDGLVFVRGNKLQIARQNLSPDTKFTILKQEKPKIIYEDDNILAVNKPPFITSDRISTLYGFKLLNRLDKETSGVVLLVKNDEFQELAIKEFKHMNVKKTYLAIVNGIFSQPQTINEPILTIKNKQGAFSKISKDGKEAISEVYPVMISGKKSLVKVIIKTGRTHQIRVHLASIGHGIIGDEKYAKSSSKRMYLHSYETEILGLKFRANLDNDFKEFGFEIPKNMEF